MERDIEVRPQEPAPSPTVEEASSARWLERLKQALPSLVGLLLMLPSCRLAGPRLSRLLAPMSTKLYAGDLIWRYFEVRRWYRGIPVYGDIVQAVYPPATYLLLWPVLGWISIENAPWMWLGLTVVASCWLMCVAVRESRPASFPERLFVATIPLFPNAFWNTLGMGQMGVIIVAILLATIFLLVWVKPSWPRDILAALLFVFALAKPQISAPFFWIVLILPNGIRVGVMAVVAYAAATWAASIPQPAGVVDLVSNWLYRTTTIYNARSTGIRNDQNLGSILITSGFRRAEKPTSLALLAALGILVYFRRKAQLWDLLAITSVVSRIWTYHLAYDDVIFIIPMIAAFRAAKERRTRLETWAATIVLALLLANLGSIYNFRLLQQAGIFVWGITLAFFIYRVRRAPTAASEDSRTTRAPEMSEA